MLRAGMRVARIDLTWGTMSFHTHSLEALETALSMEKVMCAVMVETRGRQLLVQRRCVVEDGWPRHEDSLAFQRGQKVVITTNIEAEASSSCLPVSCACFADLVHPGDILHVGRYMAAGIDTAAGNAAADVFLRVLGSKGCDVECEALNDAVIGGLAVVYVTAGGNGSSGIGTGHNGSVAHGWRPGSRVQLMLPLLSAHDKDMLQRLARRFTIHFVALSSVCSGGEVRDARAELARLGLEAVSLAAKVECRQALHNYSSIMSAADAVVLSRGSLGLDVEPEKMALVQKAAITAANVAGKPVVVARLMDSMVGAPRPTRAEATDVANAVLDGADALQLGAETLRGSFPVESVQLLARICREAEAVFDYKHHHDYLLQAALCAAASQRATMRSHWGSASTLGMLSAMPSAQHSPAPSEPNSEDEGDNPRTAHEHHAQRTPSPGTGEHGGARGAGPAHLQRSRSRLSVETHLPGGGPTPFTYSAAAPEGAYASVKGRPGPMLEYGSAALGSGSGGAGRPPRYHQHHHRRRQLPGDAAAAAGLHKSEPELAGMAAAVPAAADGAWEGRLHSQAHGSTGPVEGGGGSSSRYHVHHHLHNSHPHHLHPHFLQVHHTQRPRHSPRRARSTSPPKGRAGASASRAAGADAAAAALQQPWGPTPPAPPPSVATDAASVYAAPSGTTTDAIGGASESDEDPAGTGGAFMSKLEAVASSAVRVAEKLEAGLIIVLTHTLAAPQLLAKYRPSIPILVMVVPSLVSQGVRWRLAGADVAGRCLLTRGLMPMLAAPGPAGSATLEAAVAAACKLGYAGPASHVVVMERLGDNFCVKAVQVDAQGMGIRCYDQPGMAGAAAARAARAAAFIGGPANVGAAGDELLSSFITSQQDELARRMAQLGTAAAVAAGGMSPSPLLGRLSSMLPMSPAALRGMGEDEDDEGMDRSLMLASAVLGRTASADVSSLVAAGRGAAHARPGSARSGGASVRGPSPSSPPPAPLLPTISMMDGSLMLAALEGLAMRSPRSLSEPGEGASAARSSCGTAAERCS